jgi:hypothetical protein
MLKPIRQEGDNRHYSHRNIVSTVRSAEGAS